MRIRSIRGKITLIATLGTLCAMVIVVATTAVAMQQVLKNMDIRTLNDHVDRAVGDVEDGDYANAVGLAGSDLLQVIDAEGNVVAASRSARGLDAIVDVTDETANENRETRQLELHQREFSFPDPAPRSSAGGSGDAGGAGGSGGSGERAPLYSERQISGGSYIDSTSDLDGGGPYYVVERTVTTTVDDETTTMTVAAATSLSRVDYAVWETVRFLLMLMAVVLVAVVVFTRVLTARTLRPVDDMREQASSINASDLSTRIDVPDGDRNLSRLATTFNDLLARIEASVEQQKRFTSDASHELKSPIAATKMMLEYLREHPNEGDMEEVLADLTSENERMAQIVGDMLLLARRDENRLHVEKVPVDLLDLLLEEAAALGARSDVAVDTSGLTPVVCQADPELLSHAVRNLADNAARYAKGAVAISCSEEGGTVRIAVSDDGPGIPKADRERVFDRFVRLEESRDRKEGSTGLGLAVVRGIAERHGGSARFTDGELGGATAVIELPA